MLLTITTTHQPATDLGFLLHKNPARPQQFPLSFGCAHVFYPEADEERCTAALLVEVDPIKLARGSGERFSLQPYVNDRPFAASSFMSVAIAQVFGTALGGRSGSRQELAESVIPLLARLPVVPARGGADLLERLFAPLGYALRVEQLPLDARFPEWGESCYFGLELEGRVRLQDLLAHLYVLLPVLDDEKHYWVGEAEVEKLLRHGGAWLATHPERELIAGRYLLRLRSLAREALARLNEGIAVDDELEETGTHEEVAVEEPLRLHDVRHAVVLDAVRESGAASVLDLGCGEGGLLRDFLKERSLTRIAGMDVSYRTLERAGRHLQLDRMPPAQRERISLFQGSLLYRDRRLQGFDAAVAVEVIEHLDPTRLSHFVRAVFEFARPQTIVITTPNREYNPRWQSLPGGAFRHPDHRFEWTRSEFEAWAHGISGRFGYSVRFQPVGPEHPEYGPPTQMGVFSRG